MVRLDLDLPLPAPLDELRIEPRYEDLIKIIEKCEFKSLLEEIRKEAAKLTEPVKGATVMQGELF
jgi:DNA polymerase-1